MKTVHELNRNELEELRSSYFYNEDIEHDFVDVFKIPDKVLFEYYETVGFVEEDFFCNLENN